MFGTILRLMAVGEAGRRVGDYVQNLIRRYLALGIAGMAFLAAFVFLILAVFWALLYRNGPVTSAVIMAVILALAGLLIVLIAYGITREKPPSVKQALMEPVHAAQSQIPTVDDVGREIERAVAKYGPVRVTAAAAVGGLVAGLMAKRLRQI
jgi:hypothetical protein